MARFDWHKREHRKALIGTKGLSLELRGAYQTVQDLIYDTEDNLHDDDRYLAGWMNVDVRQWRRIKQQLIDAGKITVEDGLIHNPKCSEVVRSALDRHKIATYAARVGVAKRWPERNKDNGLFGAVAIADALQSQSQSKKRDFNGLKKSHLSTQLSTPPARKQPSQEPLSQALRDTIAAKANGANGANGAHKPTEPNTEIDNPSQIPTESDNDKPAPF